jgi:putative FmdB family regulatory protein
MPIYEYKCSKCDAVLEELRSIKSRDESTICPKCNMLMERIYSRFNAINKSTEGHSSASQNNVKLKKPEFSDNANLFKDCSFKNFNKGISMSKGIKINIQNCKFDNVSTPIEVIED